MMLSNILLQITSEADTIAESAAEGEAKLSILELLSKGGLVMIPIFIMAVAAIYLFVERYLTIKKAADTDSDFMNNIREMVVNGDIEGAQQLCRDNPSPIARMIEKGIARIGRPLKDISASIENAGSLEIYKLEKNLASLGTIAGVAPMIGFLGTVTGMIRAFYNLSMAGNNIDPGMLAGGIYEAMITTASGLAVGIVAYVGYNYLSTLIGKVIFKMEATTVGFIDLLEEPA